MNTSAVYSLLILLYFVLYYAEPNNAQTRIQARIKTCTLSINKDHAELNKHLQMAPLEWNLHRHGMRIHYITRTRSTR